MKLRFLWICAFLCSSCQLFLSYEMVKIDFPEIESPHVNAMLQSWQMTYRGENHEIIQAQFPSGSTSCEVLVRKGLVTPFVLTAILSSGRAQPFSTKPAGFFYPYENHQFLWNSGFLSQLLLEAQQEISLENVNIPRLITVIDETRGRNDVWSLDYQSLLEDLIYSDLSQYSIRMKRERVVQLDVEDCDWFSQSLEAGVLKDYRLEDEFLLFTGVNRFINRQGKILEVYINSDGSYEYIVF